MTSWYLIRALGMVSLLALTGSVCLGALATVGSRRPEDVDTRLVRQLVHRSLSVLGLAVLVGHVVLAVLDSYVDIPLTSVVVPFTAGYRPVAIALGTLAVYAFITTAIAGWARGRLASSARAASRWRAVHLTAYLGWVLAMAHGLLAGTDTGTWWGIATYAACALLTAAALVARLGVRDRRVPDHSTRARTLDPGALV